ncbi:MAG: uracil-DNA glycosylase [Erysipelotrichales bacterium]
MKDNNLEIKDAFKNVADDWLPFIDKELEKEEILQLIKRLEIEYKKKEIFPKSNDLLRALNLTSLSNTKVVIIGQDPYHTPGVADGLAFSSKQEKVPPSLRNVFKEIEATTGIKNSSPNLEGWAIQGILLLNTVLSVEQGEAKSHSKIGWQEFVIDLIKYIDSNKEVIFILWGNDAKSYEKYLVNAQIIKGAHPSPLSARLFFGHDYFNKVNALLRKKGLEEIDWRTQ